MTPEQQLQTARTIKEMLQEIIRMSDSAELGMTSYLLSVAFNDLDVVIAAEKPRH